jgi:hypothetical protein
MSPAAEWWRDPLSPAPPQAGAVDSLSRYGLTADLPYDYVALTIHHENARIHLKARRLLALNLAWLCPEGGR